MAFSASVPLWPWPSHPKMYTAVLQDIIYQLAQYEQDPMKNGREIAERR